MSKNIIGQPTTYPQVDSSPEHQFNRLQYSLDCETWARSLNETNLRELASDYMRTPELLRTEEMIDAYNEFRRRESRGLLREQKNAAKSPSTRKSRTR